MEEKMDFHGGNIYKIFREKNIRIMYVTSFLSLVIFSLIFTGAYFFIKILNIK